MCACLFCILNYFWSRNRLNDLIEPMANVRLCPCLNAFIVIVIVAIVVWYTEKKTAQRVTTLRNYIGPSVSVELRTVSPNVAQNVASL